MFDKRGHLLATALVAATITLCANASELQSIEMTVDDSDQMTINIDINERAGYGVIEFASAGY